ncbi:MAG TPA: hypothetical protein VFQ26_09830, partial [Nitrospiraceae bacterium]|nr:hypothetical protein [Nitrospiraceae bacterium]
RSPLITRHKGEKTNGLKLEVFGEAKGRWAPTQEVHASHAGGTTSGLCPSGALPPPRASAIGAAPCLPFSSGAALQSDRDRLTHDIRP